MKEPSASRRNPWSQLMRSRSRYVRGSPARSAPRTISRSSHSASQSSGSTSGNRRATAGCIATRSTSGRASCPSGNSSSAAAASKIRRSAGRGRSSTVHGSRDAASKTSRASGRYVAARGGRHHDREVGERAVLASLRTAVQIAAAMVSSSRRGVGRRLDDQRVVRRESARRTPSRARAPAAAASPARRCAFRPDRRSARRRHRPPGPAAARRSRGPGRAHASSAPPSGSSRRSRLLGLRL